jgi:hypothetical protein
MNNAELCKELHYAGTLEVDNLVNPNIFRDGSDCDA